MTGQVHEGIVLFNRGLAAVNGGDSVQNYRRSMEKLHHKGMGPPLTGNSVGSPRQGPLTPRIASANVRNDPANQQRNSTSPSEEEGSSPRGGDHIHPPGPPQNMRNGVIHPPMNMAYQSMAGFGSPMSPGMVSIPTPAMKNLVQMTPEVGPV